jgi:hypothetical protein
LTHKIAGKFPSVYGNVYVKIPRRKKCVKIFHSVGMCVGKLLEIQNTWESLVWKMLCGKLS